MAISQITHPILDITLRVTEQLDASVHGWIKSQSWIAIQRTVKKKWSYLDFPKFRKVMYVIHCAAVANVSLKGINSVHSLSPDILCSFSYNVLPREVKLIQERSTDLIKVLSYILERNNRQYRMLTKNSLNKQW